MSGSTVRCALALALVQCFALPLGAQSAASGRIEGLVVDSLHSGPMVGASVSARPLEAAVPSSAVVTTSDKRGRFSFEGLAPGRYAVTFASGLLDSLEFGLVPTLVTVAPGGTARADIGMPSGQTLRLTACPGTGLARYTGALLGVVTDAETKQPLADVTLTVKWNELAVDSAAQDLAPASRSAQAMTNSAGQYRLCGLPTEQRLEVHIHHFNAAGPVLAASIVDEEGVLVRNLMLRAVAPRPAVGVPESTVERLRTGTATLSGRVTRADGRPMTGVQLRVVNTPSFARSDEQGNFVLANLPGGPQELEARHLGYGFVRRSIEVPEGQTVRETVVMVPVASLDSVRVVARGVRFTEFERNRLRWKGGIFLDEDEIARRGFKTLPLMLANVPGFHMTAASRGRIGIQSLYNNRCQGAERQETLNLVVDNMEHVDLVDVNFNEVAAIEAYPDGSKAPFKYARACAVVVVWTKYIARRPSKFRPPE